MTRYNWYSVFLQKESFTTHVRIKGNTLRITKQFFVLCFSFKRQKIDLLKKIVVIDMSQSRVSHGFNQTKTNRSKLICISIKSRRAVNTQFCLFTIMYVPIYFTLSCRRVFIHFLFSLFKIVQNKIVPMHFSYVPFSPTRVLKTIRESRIRCVIETIHEIEQYSL